jgi:hypothetical protein
MIKLLTVITFTSFLYMCKSGIKKIDQLEIAKKKYEYNLQFQTLVFDSTKILISYDSINIIDQSVFKKDTNYIFQCSYFNKKSKTYENSMFKSVSKNDFYLFEKNPKKNTIFFGNVYLFNINKKTTSNFKKDQVILSECNDLFFSIDKEYDRNINIYNNKKNLIDQISFKEYGFSVKNLVTFFISRNETKIILLLQGINSREDNYLMLVYNFQII